MKIPKGTYEIAVLIIVLAVGIAIGHAVLSNFDMEKLNNDMCQLCADKGWYGEIRGELSYSCEWSYNGSYYMPMREWCEKNAPLFAINP